MFVCVARLTLQIPESGSLKAKRQVLRRVTDRVKARFNVAVAEVDDQDLWQKASLALAVVGNERRHVDEQMEKIIHFVEEMYVAPLISREKELLAFGDTLYPHEVASPPAPRNGRREKDEGSEAEPEGLSPDELIASLNRGERSMAEAEGLGEWERRHEGREGASRPAQPAGEPRTLDEARARARTLRNPRDWEKK
ncbi:DUF503 domain-containing protein [Stigmatella aurantiaca]|uniref:Orf3 protein n=2 Tax=Stigmatella aurantiaca TaxID=41 RepID=O05339_STIAU|nr:DUF503 domain-containing protein [Stigmatella aurantiaca]ADO73950.1 conserved uncharacterized protein [Stigmatella aurantiaca DW4/3-1]EAU69172.1 conserved hypothetical protein [Stigmatella aurantiaca DW4/3-1]CAA61163.1 orf3 [Stigmatella aurantiaca]